MPADVVPLDNQRSLISELAAQYGIDAKQFVATLRASFMPKEATNEDMATFLIIAKKYNLNPFLREIYCFPKRGGGLQTIVGVDGWANLINQHPQFDGAEFAEHHDRAGKVTGITCKIYRKDRAQPVAITEYLAECKRNTEVWQQWPLRMLRHRALIQCGRYAFGFAGLIDPDEAEFERLRDVTPAANNQWHDAGPPRAADWPGEMLTEEEIAVAEEGPDPEPPPPEEPLVPAAPPAKPAVKAGPPLTATKAPPRNLKEYLAMVGTVCAEADDAERLRAWFVSDQQRKIRNGAGMTAEDTKDARVLVEERCRVIES